jgi:hypothetical protein
VSLKFPGTKFSPYCVRCLDRPNTGVMGCIPALDADAYPVVFPVEGVLLGAFVNCEKRLLVSPRMSVCLSALPHGTTLLPPFVLRGILYFRIFPKSVEAVQVSLKSGKSNGTVLYMKINIRLWSYLAEFFLEWETFQSYRENQNTHFIIKNTGWA